MEKRNLQKLDEVERHRSPIRVQGRKGKSMKGKKADAGNTAWKRRNAEKAKDL